MKAPKIPSFLKQNQYNTYTPRYRYYDPAKERREKREKMYGKSSSEGESGEEKDSSLYVRENLRDRMDRVRHVKKAGEGSSARTLVILIMVLLAGALWLSQTDWFEKVLTSFLGE